MMGKRKRRRFAAEYKAEAVKRLEESGKTLQQVADELGPRPNRLRGWRNERLAAGSAEALARRKAEGGSGRAGPAAARGQAARAGGREPEAGGGFFRPGNGRPMRYRLVAAERASFPARASCRVVGVAASGSCAWLRRRPGRRRRDDRRAGERIGAIFGAGRRACGSPRVRAELRAQGLRAGRKRVARPMREGGLTAGRRRRVPRTAGSRHDDPVAPSLLERRFAADRPDAVWLADLSHIPTGEGWLCLAAIKDLATREIVGWSMADHLRAELACDALRMALRRRQPPPGLTHHSDRGAQYACKDDRTILARHGIVQSMSRRGDRWDNAPMEGFFGGLKTELVHRTAFPTREAARRAIFEYVDAFYDRRRRHSALGFLTPAQAYERMAGAA
jgi:putative transposase